MKTQGAHAHEDRLLDFAYDELPQSEAHAVEQHLKDCARCAEALRGIRGVRRTMARLPLESEPSAGLDSLLAYAQQSARRSAAGAAPAPRWWRRLMAPALGVAAVSVFGVVVFQVNRDVDLSATLQRSSASDQSSRTSSAPAAAAPLAAAPLAAVPPPPPPAVATAPSEARDMPSGDWGNASSGNWGNASSGRGRAEKKGAVRSLPASEPEAFAARAPAKAPVVQAAPAAPMPAQKPQHEDAFKDEPKRASRQAPASRVAAEAPAPSVVASAADSARDDDERSEPSASAEKEEQALGGGEEGLGGGARSASAPGAPRASPSPAELLRQADLALRSSDRAREVMFLRAALNAGAQGTQALAALSRLCDAETVLGNQRSAIEACKRVVSTAPGSSEARAAQRLLQGPLQD